MEISRKKFLLSSAGLFALFGGLSRNNAVNLFSTKALGSTSMSMLYDSSRCIGCKMCEKGCKGENDPGQIISTEGQSEPCYTGIKSIKTSSGRNLFFKRQCLHCSEASCESVCPTGAAAHHGDYVLIDQDVCIGCGYCEEACPFGIPHRDEETAAQKCTFCCDRIESGREPACASACPIGATTYGVREDLLVAANTRVDTLKKTGYPEAQIYGENELGGLNVLYVLQKAPNFYGLPENPTVATKNLLIQWISGSVTAAALIVPFWYFYKRRFKQDKGPADQKESVK